MKVIKPQLCTIFTRNYEFRSRFHLGVTVAICHDFVNGKLLTEQATWQTLAAYLEQGFREEAIPRARSEYLVMGHAYPPGEDKRTFAVQVNVGSLKKRLNIWPRRYWNGERILTDDRCDPVPLAWNMAGGGEGLEWNPSGLGHAPAAPELPLELPRIEYPEYPWTSPDSPIPPAGFGPIDQEWQPRKSRVGTYDQRWFENEYPGIASDTDWRFFNLSPDDQQQPDPFSGIENFRLENLHPEYRVLEGTLPGLVARAFIDRASDDGIRLEEIPLTLRALWFFPDETCVLMIHQGVAMTSEEDAADIRYLVTAVERHGQPRTLHHYAKVLRKRLDPDKGALEALRESDLSPPDCAVNFLQGLKDMPQDPVLARMQKHAESERARMRSEIATRGEDPDRYLPREDTAPPPRVETLDDLIDLSERLESEADRIRERAIREAKERLDALKPELDQAGIDMDGLLTSSTTPRSSGPPVPPGGLVENILGTSGTESGDPSGFVDDLMNDKAMADLMKRAETESVHGYRLSCHQLLPVERKDDGTSRALREEVIGRYRKGESLAGMDLTGCDLAGLNLSGADLTGAFLENADLSSCDLSGACLDDAVLAHANLIGCRLDGASLRGANLGASRLTNAVLREADLRNAILEKARLQGTDLSRSRLDDVRLHEASFENVDFSGSRTDAELLFVKQSLQGCMLREIRWKHLIMIECDIRHADFSNALIGKAAFVSVIGKQAVFRGIHMDAACFTSKCDLEQADFSGCRLHEISFRESNLSGANFTSAFVTACDFSECILSHAIFRQANAVNSAFRRADLTAADFTGTNLMHADLSLATVKSACFEDVNLHESDWARVRFDNQTRIHKALTTRMRTHPRYRQDTRA